MGELRPRWSNAAGGGAQRGRPHLRSRQGVGGRHRRGLRHTATERVPGNGDHRWRRLIPDRPGVCGTNPERRSRKVLRFASTFRLLSLVPRAFTIRATTGSNWKNAIVAVPISLLIGTGLGIAQRWLARVCTARRRAFGLDGSPVAHGDGRKAQ